MSGGQMRLGNIQGQGGCSRHRTGYLEEYRRGDGLMMMMIVYVDISLPSKSGQSIAIGFQC